MTDAEREARLVYSPGAYAVVRGDQPQVFLAENAAVISRLLALKLVARASPRLFSASQLAAARAALLEERWADAILAWMEATGQFVDVYEEYVHVWTEADLDADFASMEIRVAPIFDEDWLSDAPAAIDDSMSDAPAAIEDSMSGPPGADEE